MEPFRYKRESGQFDSQILHRLKSRIRLEINFLG